MMDSSLLSIFLLVGLAVMLIGCMFLCRQKASHQHDSTTISHAVCSGLVLVPVLLLAACQQKDSAPVDLHKIKPATRAAAIEKKAQCAAVPEVARSRLHFADPRGTLSAQRGPIDQTATNFQAAYSRACSEGLLSAKPLIDPRSADKRHIFLANAPDANVASIYFDQDAQLAPKEWNTVIEYSFYSADGDAVTVPTAEELHEAIYCAVHGATPEEEQKDGRCLPD